MKPYHYQMVTQWGERQLFMATMNWEPYKALEDKYRSRFGKRTRRRVLRALAEGYVVGYEAAGRLS